jgi:ribosomal protein L24
MYRSATQQKPGIIRKVGFKKFKKQMSNTNKQFDAVIQSAKDIFIKKTKDYGTSWRVLRTISVVDQIFIKALRIRTIQEKQEQKVGDDIASEFKGIINYAVIGMIQLQLDNLPVEDCKCRPGKHLVR